MQLAEYTFPNICQAPLITPTFKPRVIALPRAPPSRLLLLSDTHLGATGAIDAAIPQFVGELADLVAQERATQVFHLGDLIDGTIPGGALPLGDVLSRLASLRVPVTVIGGNHDREFCAQFASAPRPVSVVQELAIQLSIPADGAERAQRVFLAHDLGNNYRVRDQLTFVYLHWIKSSYPKIIRDADWLVTGHCHMGFVSAASRLACVGQFSPEIHARTYAVLEVEKGKVELTVKQLI
jgi:predicted phosphodiesterase